MKITTFGCVSFLTISTQECFLPMSIAAEELHISVHNFLVSPIAITDPRNRIGLAIARACRIIVCRMVPIMHRAKHDDIPIICNAHANVVHGITSVCPCPLAFGVTRQPDALQWNLTACRAHLVSMQANHVIVWFGATTANHVNFVVADCFGR